MIKYCPIPYIHRRKMANDCPVLSSLRRKLIRDCQIPRGHVFPIIASDGQLDITLS